MGGRKKKDSAGKSGIKFVSAGDQPGVELGEYVYLDGKNVGHIKKAVFGPGYFLHVFGKKWQNAPGARYPQELDARTDLTYCKTKKVAERRVCEALGVRRGKE